MTTVADEMEMLRRIAPEVGRLSRLLTQSDRERADWKRWCEAAEERAQIAEADTAALLARLDKAYPAEGYDKNDEFGGCVYCEVGEPGYEDFPETEHKPDCYWREMREFLRQPHPGTALLERMQKYEVEAAR